MRLLAETIDDVDVLEGTFNVDLGQAGSLPYKPWQPRGFIPAFR